MYMCIRKSFLCPSTPQCFLLYGKEEEGKLFLILMYIKLPMYLKQCRMGGGRRRGGEGKKGLPLIHSCSKKLSAHKLYNIQKIKYRKLMYIKLSTEKCKGLAHIKN